MNSPRGMLLLFGIVVCGLGFGQVDRRVSLDVDYFSIVFPGEFETSKTVLRWESGQIVSNVYASNFGPARYQVMVSPLPREVVRAKSPQILLDAARDGTLTGAKMTIEGEQKLLVNGAPARRFIVNTADSASVVHLVAVANGRLYHASATVLRQDLGKGVDFVKSFSLSAVVSG